MALQNDLERYEEWRSTFRLAEEGPHTFRQLEKLRRIDNIAWSNNGHDNAEDKVTQICQVLSE